MKNEINSPTPTVPALAKANRGGGAAEVPPCASVASSPIGVPGHAGPRLREADAPTLPPSSALGKRPPCKACGRGFYSCICDPFFDDEQVPADDVLRIMGQLYPESGWGLAEKSAYGMGDAK